MPVSSAARVLASTNRAADVRRAEVRQMVVQWPLIWVYVLTYTGYAVTSAVPAALGIESRPITIIFRAVLAISATVAFGMAAARREPIIRNRIWFFFIGFWALYFLRLFHDTILTDSVFGFPVEEYWLIAAGGVFFPCLAFFVVPNHRSTLIAAKLLLYVNAVAMVLNLQIGYDLELFAEQGRFQTTTLNAISFGFLGATSVILAGFLYAQRDALALAEGGKSALSRLLFFGFLLISIAVGVYTIYLSGSRGPALGAVGGIAFLFIYSTKLDSAARVRVVLLALFFLILSWFALPDVQELGGAFIERLSSTGSLQEGQDLSDQYRLALWTNAIDQFLSSPIFGSGVEEQVYNFYPHNMAIEAFMATGIVGGLLFLIIAFRSAVSALNILKIAPHAGWVSMMYLLQCASALTSGAIWSNLPFWATALLVIAVEQNYRRIARNKGALSASK